MMPFGKYGPHKGDPRKLSDVPVSYLRHLSQQDWMYQHRELGDYIEEKLEREALRLAEKTKPQPKLKPQPSRGPRMTSSLEDFAKTL